MCFSAEASLISSGVLAAIGGLCLKKSQQSNQKFLAVTPLIFSVQQFSEGIVWLSFNHALPGWVTQVGMYGFLLFAFIFWPIWMPFSLAKAEIHPIKRKTLYLLAILGAILAAVFIVTGLSAPVQVVQREFSLAYLGEVPPLYIPYILIGLSPFYISSLPKAKIVGLLFTIACAISAYYYFEVFTSIWCFVSALISTAFYFLLRNVPDEAQSLIFPKTKNIGN